MQAAVAAQEPIVLMEWMAVTVVNAARVNNRGGLMQAGKPGTAGLGKRRLAIKVTGPCLDGGGSRSLRQRVQQPGAVLLHQLHLQLVLVLAERRNHDHRGGVTGDLGLLSLEGG